MRGDVCELGKGVFIKGAMDSGRVFGVSVWDIGRLMATRKGAVISSRTAILGVRKEDKLRQGPIGSWVPYFSVTRQRKCPAW